MRKKLTKATLEMKAPATGRIEIRDTDSPLALRISSDGSRSLAVRTRLHGKQVRFTYPKGATIENLTNARTWAHSMIDACRQGVDPREHERREKEKRDRNSFEAVYEEWFRRDQSKNKSAEATRQQMDKDALSRWKGRRIDTITRRDIIEALDAIVDRGAAVHANRVHAYLHRLFKWAVQRDILAANPMADLPKPTQDRSRDRVLEDGELARIWHAAGRLNYPFGPAIKLLMLTGARRAEIGALQWSEIDLDAGEIHLPGNRTKSGQPHTIPLVSEAVAILKALPRISHPETRKVGLVFTTTGRSPISGWSRAKHQIDDIAAKIDAAGKRLDNPEPLESWRLHDIRRTVATGCQRLGVRLEVTEAVLGHVSGSRRGVIGIYQRYSWDSEKRRALDAWAEHVAAIAEGRKPADNVLTHPAAEAV